MQEALRAKEALLLRCQSSLADQSASASEARTHAKALADQVDQLQADLASVRSHLRAELHTREQLEGSCTELKRQLALAQSEGAEGQAREAAARQQAEAKLAAIRVEAEDLRCAAPLPSSCPADGCSPAAQQLPCRRLLPSCTAAALRGWLLPTAGCCPATAADGCTPPPRACRHQLRHATAERSAARAEVAAAAEVARRCQHEVQALSSSLADEQVGRPTPGGGEGRGRAGGSTGQEPGDGRGEGGGRRGGCRA